VEVASSYKQATPLGFPNRRTQKAIQTTTAVMSLAITGKGNSRTARLPCRRWGNSGLAAWRDVDGF
jgi:hypothetical protein